MARLILSIPGYLFEDSLAAGKTWVQKKKLWYFCYCSTQSRGKEQLNFLIYFPCLNRDDPKTIKKDSYRTRSCKHASSWYML